MANTPRVRQGGARVRCPTCNRYLARALPGQRISPPIRWPRCVMCKEDCGSPIDLVGYKVCGDRCAEALADELLELGYEDGWEAIHNGALAL